MAEIAPPHGAGLLSLQGVAEATPMTDPEEADIRRLRDLGKELVNYLFQSLRILGIHHQDNSAVEEPLRRLHAALQEIAQAVHRTHFITVEGQVYLNDLRIRMDATAYTNVQFVVNTMGRHGIGGITFAEQSQQKDLKSLLLLLLRHKPPKAGEGDPLESVRGALEKADLPGFEFDRPYYFKSGGSDGAGLGAGGEEGEGADQELAALAYAKGVLAVKDYFRAVEAAEAANPLRIRKIVHDLVDVAEDDPEDFLKLHTIHGVEDPYYNHCVNVSALAVAVGRQLGLSRVELADLGIAAMFHDLGYAALERDQKDLGREWTDDEKMKLHPVAGFRALLRQGEYGPGLMRRLLVNLEHHMHWKRPGGYPHLGRKKLSVYTRIVAVADHYDALVTPLGETPGLLPVKALERIVAARGLVFDPVVVKALVNVVGRYPYGSMVEMNTGEVGVVTSGARTEETFLRPRIMIVRKGDQKIDPFEVDLAQAPADGVRRRVVKVLDPYSEGVTPHAVLFESLAEIEKRKDEEERAAADAARAARDAAGAPAGLPGPPADSGGNGQGVAAAAADAAAVPSAGGAAAGGAGASAPAAWADPWGFGMAADDPWGPAGGGSDRPLADEGDAEDDRGNFAVVTDPWEGPAAAGHPGHDETDEIATLRDGEETSSLADLPLTATARSVPARPAASPSSSAAAAEPSPRAATEGGASTSGKNPRPAGPPHSWSEDEIARRKAAWKKALTKAWAEGGEAAVREMAHLTWADFEPEESRER